MKHRVVVPALIHSEEEICYDSSLVSHFRTLTLCLGTGFGTFEM